MCFFEKVCQPVKKVEKSIDFFLDTRYNTSCSQEWRNWQTRTVQVRVVAIP